MKLLLITLIINQNIFYQDTNSKIIYLPYYQRLTNQEIIKQLEIKKDYEKYEFNVEPTFSHIGTKSYILYAIDKNGNQDIYDFKINIYDDVAPLIYGPDEIIIKDNKVDINLLKTSYVAYDEIDGYLPIYIEETSFSFDEEKDNYYIRYFCEDKSKNIAKKYVKIYINKNNYGFYYTKNPQLTLYKNNSYNIKDIIDMLIKNSYLENLKYENYYFLSTTSRNIKINKTGMYDLALIIKKDNIENTINIKINVIDEPIKKHSFISELINMLIDLLRDIL